MKYTVVVDSHLVKTILTWYQLRESESTLEIVRVQRVGTSTSYEQDGFLPCMHVCIAWRDTRDTHSSYKMKWQWHQDVKVTATGRINCHVIDSLMYYWWGSVRRMNCRIVTYIVSRRDLFMRLYSFDSFILLESLFINFIPYVTEVEFTIIEETKDHNFHDY